jgi:hypothetical protein
MLAHSAYAAARGLRGFGQMTGMGLWLRCRNLMGMSVGRFGCRAMGRLPMSGLRLVLIASLPILLPMGGLMRFGSVVPVSPAMLLAMRLGSPVGASVRSAALMAV